MGSKETDMTEQLHTHTYTSKLSSVIESSFGNENLKNIFKKLLRYTWVKWEPRAIHIPYIFLPGFSWYEFLLQKKWQLVERESLHDYPLSFAKLKLLW